MKITVKQKLNVNKEEFFDYLLAVLLKELKHSVSKKITKNDLKEGFEFERRVKIKDNKYITKCKLAELNDNVYHLQINNGSSVQNVVHHVRVIDNEHIEDTYSEYVETSNWKIKFQSIVDHSNIKSQMRDTLKKFEVQIMGRR